METFLYWAVVIAYSIGMIAIGVYIWLRNKGKPISQLEFWIAQRQLPSWWLAMSLTAGWLMLGWIGFGISQIYMYGATGLWIIPIPWFVLCFLIILLVPFYRRVGAVSLPQMLEKRFGKPARILIAFFSFFVFIFWAQAETFMAGTLLSPFLGIDPKLCMVLIVIPVIIYTYLGGFRAVVMTDVFQFSLMAIFMIILTSIAITSAINITNGNVIQAIASTSPPWSGAGQAFNFNFLGIGFPIILLLGYLPGWLIEQDLSVRMQAAKSTKNARKAAWLGLLLIGTFVIILPTIIGFCSMVVFPASGGVPHEAVGATGLTIISSFISQLPLWLSAFMVVGIVASQMSTIDTFSNVSAMPIAYDIIDPILVKAKISQFIRANVSKLVSVAVLLIALLLAFLSESLNDVYYITSGVLSASIAVQVIFMFWKRTTLPAVIISSVIGFVATVGGYFLEYKILLNADGTTSLPAPFNSTWGYNYLALGVVLSLFTIIIVSILTRRSPQNMIDNVKPMPVDDYQEFELSSAN